MQTVKIAVDLTNVEEIMENQMDDEIFEDPEYDYGHTGGDEHTFADDPVE